jgi:hypothetical protein
METKTSVTEVNIDTDFIKQLESKSNINYKKIEFNAKIEYALKNHYPRLTFCDIADVCGVDESTIRRHYKKINKR